MFTASRGKTSGSDRKSPSRRSKSHSRSRRAKHSCSGSRRRTKSRNRMKRSKSRRRSREKGHRSRSRSRYREKKNGERKAEHTYTEDGRRSSRSRSNSCIWRRIDRLKRRSPSRRRRHLNFKDEEEWRELERKLKVQIRGGRCRGAAKSALRIAELGQKLPDDLQLQMLEAAAKEPGTAAVFAQTLQVTVIGGSLTFKIEEYAKIVGILMQREAPEPQLRAFLNCALPKRANVLPIIPRDLSESEVAQLFDEGLQSSERESADENDILEDEDDREKGGPPPSVIQFQKCNGRPDLNGKYVISLELSCFGWPVYEKEQQVIRDIVATDEDEQEQCLVHFRPTANGIIVAGWTISTGLQGEVLAVNPKETRSPPCLGWLMVQGKELAPDAGGFVNKQVASMQQVLAAPRPMLTQPAPLLAVPPPPTAVQPCLSEPPGTQSDAEHKRSGAQSKAAGAVPPHISFNTGPNAVVPPPIEWSWNGHGTYASSASAEDAENLRPLAATLKADKEREAKEKEYREARSALERLNLSAMRGSIRSSSNGIAEYFGHFINLMHLEFMADRRQIRRRRERAPADKLVKWGWALQNLRLINTFGRRESGKTMRTPLPGWEDHGIEMGALQMQGYVDLERLRIKRGDSVTVSLTNPLVDKLGEATVNDIKPGLVVLQLRREWPKEAGALLWRVDKAANGTLYERQMQALCMLAQAVKSQACVELLTMVPVGLADSWAMTWQKRRIEREQRCESRNRSRKRGKDSESSSDSEARMQRKREKCVKAAQEEPRGVKEPDIQAARDIAAQMPNLNDSQRAAIDAALTRTCTVIQGPPGTGKTHVSVHILSMWAQALKLSPLLATSDSNVAVDNICEGLRAQGVKAVRVGRPEKVRGVVEDMTLESELKREKSKKQAAAAEKQAIAEAQFAAEAAEDISFLVAAQAADDAQAEFAEDHLDASEGAGKDGSEAEESKARPLFTKGSLLKGKGKGVAAANGKGAPPDAGAAALKSFEARRAQNRLDFELQMKILREADVICTTTIAAGGDFLSKFSFQGILVDEVAQATELSAVVPVILRGAKRLVLVGDQCQLPPSVLSSEAEMRGLSFSVYSRLVAGGLKPFLLDTQYRSHPKLAEFSSASFYDNKLMSGITTSERVPPLGFNWPNPYCPVAFIHVDAPEECEAESKANQIEAQLLANIVQNVLRSGELTVADVGVVTPYMAQVRRLRQMLKPVLPPGTDPRLLECASVDNFQGREKELIIFSAVRSNPYGNVGFLADWRRLNVMITRPRRGLVVIGNSDTLRNDIIWDRWLSFAEENGCMVSDMPELSMISLPAPTAPPPSRLPLSEPTSSFTVAGEKGSAVWNPSWGKGGKGKGVTPGAGVVVPPSASPSAPAAAVAAVSKVRSPAVATGAPIRLPLSPHSSGPEHPPPALEVPRAKELTAFQKAALSRLANSGGQISERLKAESKSSKSQESPLQISSEWARKKEQLMQIHREQQKKREDKENGVVGEEKKTTIISNLLNVAEDPAVSSTAEALLLSSDTETSCTKPSSPDAKIEAPAVVQQKTESEPPQTMLPEASAITVAKSDVPTKVGVEASLKKGDWKCEKCGEVQFDRNLTCRKCGESRPGADPSIIKVKAEPAKKRFDVNAAVAKAEEAAMLKAGVQAELEKAAHHVQVATVVQAAQAVQAAQVAHAAQAVQAVQAVQMAGASSALVDAAAVQVQQAAQLQLQQAAQVQQAAQYQQAMAAQQAQVQLVQTAGAAQVQQAQAIAQVQYVQQVQQLQQYQQMQQLQQTQLLQYQQLQQQLQQGSGS